MLCCTDLCRRVCLIVCVCVRERVCVCVCVLLLISICLLSVCLSLFLCLSPCLLAVACQVRANVGDSALSLNSRSNIVIASHRDKEIYINLLPPIEIIRIVISKVTNAAVCPREAPNRIRKNRKYQKKKANFSTQKQ